MQLLDDTTSTLKTKIPDTHKQISTDRTKFPRGDSLSLTRFSHEGQLPSGRGYGEYYHVKQSG